MPGIVSLHRMRAAQERRRVRRPQFVLIDVPQCVAIIAFVVVLVIAVARNA